MPAMNSDGNWWCAKLLPLLYYSILPPVINMIGSNFTWKISLVTQLHDNFVVAMLKDYQIVSRVESHFLLSC